jgi:hypothetical protein
MNSFVFKVRKNNKQVLFFPAKNMNGSFELALSRLLIVFVKGAQA